MQREHRQDPHAAVSEPGADLKRRHFLQLAAGSAFLYAFHVPTASANADPDLSTYAPNAFIRLDDTGSVRLIIPQVEMGQGIYTALSMILAEELDADWARVEVEHAPPDLKLYANPMLFVQATGNSNSIRAFWKPLRQAGAGARACLIEAAALTWRVPPTECSTGHGKVTHDPSGRVLEYRALVARAATLVPPQPLALKDPAKFRLIGQSLKRLDTPAKVNGSAKYGIDALPTGVKFAALAQSPVLGGTVGHADEKRTPLVRPSPRPPGARSPAMPSWQPRIG